MKNCVVGAGAIGGYLAVLLARAGHEVTVIVRGVHLAAIKERGLQLIDPAGAEIGCVDVHATSDIPRIRRRRTSAPCTPASSS